MSDHEHSTTAVEDDIELEEDLDVDTTDEDDETPAGKAKPKAKAEKAPSAPKRGDLNDGWVTPVQFAKYLTENGVVKDADGNDKVVPPQVVYSYIKNAPKDHPFPNNHQTGDLIQVEDSNGVSRRAFKLEDGLDWWAAKSARAAERKANAASKKAAPKKSDNLQAGPAGESDDEVAEEAE